MAKKKKDFLGGYKSYNRDTTLPGNSDQWRKGLRDGTNQPEPPPDILDESTTRRNIIRRKEEDKK